VLPPVSHNSSLPFFTQVTLSYEALVRPWLLLYSLLEQQAILEGVSRRPYQHCWRTTPVPCLAIEFLPWYAPHDYQAGAENNGGRKM